MDLSHSQPHHARSAMTTDTQQTCDDNTVDAFFEKNPTGNASTVTANANTAAFEQFKEMFATAQKRSDKQGKLMGSLTKQIGTLMARSRSIFPRGATQGHSGRRLNFETPSERAANAWNNSSGHNPDEVTPTATQLAAEIFHLSIRTMKRTRLNALTWTSAISQIRRRKTLTYIHEGRVIRKTHD